VRADVATLQDQLTSLTSQVQAQFQADPVAALRGVPKLDMSLLRGAVNDINNALKPVVPQLQANLDDFVKTVGDTVVNDVTSNGDVINFVERMGVMLATDGDPSRALPQYQSDLRDQARDILDLRLCYTSPGSAFSMWVSARMERITARLNDGGTAVLAGQTITANGMSATIAPQRSSYGATSKSGYMPGAQIGVSYSF
jgi:hypothetical protein